MATGGSFTLRERQRRNNSHFETHPGEPQEQAMNDSLLRTALRQLKPFLGSLGLRPSRVLAYMQQDEGFQQFPAKERVRDMNRMESRYDVDLAASAFSEELLSEHAPSGILSHFLTSLFRANADTYRPNEGCWRVHDVLVLSCAYMEMQSAILKHEDLDLKKTALDLMNSHQMLTPEDVLRVAETVEILGDELGVVRLLSCLYTKLVADLRLEHDTLRQQGEQWQDTQTSSGNGMPDSRSFYEVCRRRFAWLSNLLNVLDHNNEDQELRADVPSTVLSLDKWILVCDRLSFRQRYEVSSDDRDDVSEAAESVAASDLISQGQPGSGRGLQTTDAGPLPSKVSEDMLQKIRAFLDDVQKQVPYSVEYVLQKLEIMTLRENCGIMESHGEKYGNNLMRPKVHISSSSKTGTSTDNNTTVQPRSDSDKEIRDLARILHFTGLADGPDHGPGQISLREYQQELLRSVREGKNVMIMLPTGTGKTFIVLKYTQEVLSRRAGFPKVVFLAPKVKLAEQQYRRFQYFYPKITYFRWGRSSTSTRAPFSELLELYQVFVMTPQCLVEAVEKKEVRIKDFSLLILDECHHAMGRHSYKVLMDQYLDAKFSDRGDEPLPQVVGLTASPGIGKGGTLDSATAYLKELCYNMNLEDISTVKQHELQLKQFANEPTHEIRECGKRKKDAFKRIIESIMQKVEDGLIQSSYNSNHLDKETREKVDAILKGPILHRGQNQYSEWASNMSSRLAQIENYGTAAYTAAYSTAEMLLIYQQALILNEDCESDYALKYLLQKAADMETEQDHSEETGWDKQSHKEIEKQLLQQFREHIPALKTACADRDDHNPKLRMLEDILLQMWDRNQKESACMVFVRTLELSKAVQQWIIDHPDLKQLNPGRITGSQKTGKSGGMTRNKIDDVLKDFNEGTNKLVVCTSAAEEGLDFQACSVVIRYDYVTSVVSMIQTRGRARRADSQYCVLGSQLQGNIDKENENLASEQLMKKAVSMVQAEIAENPNDFLHKMNQQQELEYKKRQKESEVNQRKRRAAQQDSTKFELKCRKCKQYVCASTDLRLLEGSGSRIVIAPELASGRWTRREIDGQGDSRNYTEILEKVAKVHCECGKNWGCMSRYIPSQQEFPTLSLEHFFLLNTQTGQMTTKKCKWAACPFHVESITEDELLELST